MMPVLLIEGSGGIEGDLKSVVAKCDLNNEVRFVGREKQVFNLMNAVDIMVLPSIANEDFPNVILEAMSLGKPVIASRISGTPEQVIDQESGLLVEPRDVEGLADAISLLLNDEELRTSISHNACERFEQMFSARVAVLRYCQLYDKLLKGGNA